jgi:hypothetical protein
MEDRTLVACAAAGKAMPATRVECRTAIDQLRGDIDAIKAQIAAADLERQAKHGKMDPRWYHRAAPRSATSASRSLRSPRTCRRCRWTRAARPGSRTA